MEAITEPPPELSQTDSAREARWLKSDGLTSARDHGSTFPCSYPDLPIPRSWEAAFAGRLGILRKVGKVYSAPGWHRVVIMG